MNSDYRAEAGALDAEIVRAIERRHVEDFDDLALRILAHQLRFNEPYARYCAALGVTFDRMPATWDRIPPVPAAAFKEAALCTFDPTQAFRTFETSGTTSGARGKHYIEDAVLYMSSSLAGFSDGILRHANTEFRFLMLVPDPAHVPQSSLGYMMDLAAEDFGDKAGWYLHGDSLLVDRFVQDARNAAKDGVPVIIAGTAFAFLTLLDTLHEYGPTTLPLPAGSKIMETGGFKGRTRQISRTQLYDDLSLAFGIPTSSIIAEYGMTELLSQYYDRAGDEEPRVKIAPPWLRSYAVDENGKKLPPGVVGALVHVDLANRSSCVAIQTEDLGAVVEGGIILFGREQGAELRGCSLDAESLRAAIS